MSSSVAASRTVREACSTNATKILRQKETATARALAALHWHGVRTSFVCSSIECRVDSYTGSEVKPFTVDGLGVASLVVKGLAVDGLAVDGLVVDGFDVDSLAVDGLAVDGCDVDGLAVDGLGVEGLDVDGLAVDSMDVDGLAVDGLAVDG